MLHIIFFKTWVYNMFIIHFIDGCRHDKVNRKSSLPKIPFKNETNLNINIKTRLIFFCVSKILKPLAPLLNLW